MDYSGTAFPLIDGDLQIRASGLTKRELIAAMAMQGLLAGVDWSLNESSAGWIAKNSVSLSDALLSELEKGGMYVP